MDEYRQRESLSFEKVSRKKQRSRYLTFSLDNPLLVAGFIAVVMLCIIWTIGNNIGSQTGMMERSDIGTIAAHDYKAPQDFIFDRVDYEATERIREQRVAEVLPIFKWDQGYHDATMLRIRSAFSYMRSGLKQERMRLEHERVGREVPGALTQHDEVRQQWADKLIAPYIGGLVFDEYLTTRPLNAAEIESGLDQWTEKHRENFVQAMEYVVSDELFDWLSSQNFSEVLENGVVDVVDIVLGRMIVSTRQEIDNVGNMTVQWYEGIERRTKTIEKTEKAKISTLEASESSMMKLLRERFVQSPAVFIQYFKQFVRPNMAYDQRATERERQSVRDKTVELRVREEYKKGQTIIARGNPIKASHYEVFEKIAQSQGDLENRAAHWTALFIVMGVLLFMLWRSIVATTARRQKNRDLVYMAVGFLIFAIALRASMLLSHVLDSVYHWPYSILLLFPFAAGPMLVRIVINRYYAYLFSVVSVVLTSLIVEDNNLILSYAIVSTMAGCLLMERPKRSNVVLQRGFLMGLIAALVSISIYLLKGANLTNSDYVVVGILSLGSGLLSAGCVTIGLPVAESLYGYVTSNKLLELSNLEHPALKALFLEAPGTYQHSIMVGTLNEAAADAIGANSILARVGGYYHDIGKVKNAQYFAENQRGDNPHNRLNPNMSALILKTHERDGLEIAKKYKLPQDIRDFIATHHGTSRIEYFYQRAKEQQDRVHEEDYRYPGPRPQTRETGICMVSDMVEAAVRSLPDKSPDKILVLVHKLINHKFTDGQFDECDLTLRDLNDIANALIGILNAFYHHRPEYPDQKREREKAEREKAEREKAEAEKKDRASENADSASAAKDAGSVSQTMKKTAVDNNESKKNENDPKPDKIEKQGPKSSKGDKIENSAVISPGNKNEKSESPESADKNTAAKFDKNSKTDDLGEKDDKRSKEERKESKNGDSAARNDSKTEDQSDKSDKNDKNGIKSDKQKSENVQKTDRAAESEGKPDKTARKSEKGDRQKNDRTQKGDKQGKSEKSSKNSCKVQEAADLKENRETERVEDVAEIFEPETDKEAICEIQAEAHAEAAAESSDESEEISEGEADRENREADELLKENETEDDAAVSDHGISADAEAMREAYDLTFSSQVDVFKRS